MTARHAHLPSTLRARVGVALLGLCLGFGLLAPTVTASEGAVTVPQMFQSSHLVTNELSTASRGNQITISAPAPAPAPKPEAVVVATAVYAAEVFVQTNVERAAVGLAPLKRLSKLDAAAAMHANDQRNVPCQVGYLTHTGTDGSKGVDRILRTGLSISRWGENIACAHSSSASVMAGWMKSAGHRANILHTEFTHIGVSVAASDTGRLYWVQEFATLR